MQIWILQTLKKIIKDITNITWKIKLLVLRNLKSNNVKQFKVHQCTSIYKSNNGLGLNLFSLMGSKFETI